MKKKLLSLVLILALALTALTAVGCGSDFSKTYTDPYSQKAYSVFMNHTKVLASGKNIELDYNAGNVGQDSNLFTATKDVDGHTQRIVYNLETEKIVGTFTETDTVTYTIFAGGMLVKDAYYDIFRVEKETYDADNDEYVSEYTIYDADGNAIGTSNEMPNIKIDTLFIDNDYFRVNKNGKFEKAGSRAKNAAALPDFNTLNNGRYYYFDDDTLFVYNDSFVLTNFYQVPSYANDCDMFVLNNGNVLIQYKYSVAFFDTDYTYYDGANNVKVITQIYNVKDSKTTDIETVCLFNGLTARDSEPFGIAFRSTYGSSIENLDNVSYIINKRLDNNNKTVSIKNDGKIDCVLNEFLTAQVNEPRNISSGRFVVATRNGSTYLVNADGKILADITGVDVHDDINLKYIVFDGKIYDHNFKELASFDTEKWEYMLMNNTVVLNSVENAKQYKLFVNGEFKEFTLAENEAVAGGSTRHYVISKTVDTTTTYTYYNENGEVLLADYALLLNPKGTARNGKMVMSRYDGANTKYVNIVFSTETKK